MRQALSGPGLVARNCSLNVATSETAKNGSDWATMSVFEPSGR